MLIRPINYAISYPHARPRINVVAQHGTQADPLPLRSSGRLSTTLVPRRSRFIWPMLFQTAFSFSGVIQRLAGRCSGLRLRAACLFQVFLATCPCAASATSYHFSCVAPPRWRSAFSQFAPVAKLGFPVLAIGSNHSSQPTAYGGG